MENHPPVEFDSKLGNLRPVSLPSFGLESNTIIIDRLLAVYLSIHATVCRFLYKVSLQGLIRWKLLAKDKSDTDTENLSVSPTATEIERE